MAISKFSFYHVDLRKLPETDECYLMMRIALAVSDVAAADCLWKLADDSSLNEKVKWGLREYTIRLQVSILAEIMKRPDKQGRSGALYGLLNCPAVLDPLLKKLGSEGKIRIDKLRSVMTGGSEDDFKRRVIAIRDKLTFHYDEAEVKDALCLFKAQAKTTTRVARIGKKSTDIRFEFADAVRDRAVFHVLWGVNPTTESDFRAKVDEIAVWCQELAHAFLDVGVNLCDCYFRQYAA